MDTGAAIKIVPFSQINLDDSFFDTLKTSYSEFPNWFKNKSKENAYVVYNESQQLQAFLYIKLEKGPVTDIAPPLNVPLCLKVGTFKAISHGTKLGERFVKIIFDAALSNNLRHVYVTVFEQHEPLIQILKNYGFKKYGIKKTPNGTENVYVKDMTYPKGNTLLDYPVIYAQDHSKWLLAIYPQYHSILFPDSILKTEPRSMIADTSHTNSIHKIYVGFLGDMPKMKQGDCVVIYRCQAQPRNEIAWYKSVATSICVIEEVRLKSTFSGVEEFIEYCHRYSIFSTKELTLRFKEKKYFELCAIKMTYNLALPKRPNLATLVEAKAVPHPSSGQYFGLMRLSDEQFKSITNLGKAHEGFVIY